MDFRNNYQIFKDEVELYYKIKKNEVLYIKKNEVLYINQIKRFPEKIGVTGDNIFKMKDFIEKSFVDFMWNKLVESKSELEFKGTSELCKPYFKGHAALWYIQIIDNTSNIIFRLERKDAENLVIAPKYPWFTFDKKMKLRITMNFSISVPDFGNFILKNIGNGSDYNSFVFISDSPYASKFSHPVYSSLRVLGEDFDNALKLIHHSVLLKNDKFEEYLKETYLSMLDYNPKCGYYPTLVRLRKEIDEHLSVLKNELDIKIEECFVNNFDNFTKALQNKFEEIYKKSTIDIFCAEAEWIH